jgi:poly(3-hydroxybutyrate) depolymerase
MVRIIYYRPRGFGDGAVPVANSPRTSPAGLSLLLVLFLVLLAPAVGRAEIPVGLGEFEFIDPEGNEPQPVRVWTYRPETFTPEAPVVFVMHGMLRNGETYRRPWIPIADETPCLMVVPEFSTEHYPESRTYQFGNLRNGEGEWNEESRWTFTAIERLFDHVREQAGSRRERYYLFGHSAGSQFVHRMLLFMPQVRVELAIAANAGSYTLPTHEVAYPYGLKDSPLAPEHLAERLSRPMVVLLGSEDTDPEDRSLPRAKGAMAQGPHRVARGELFFETARNQADELGCRLNWSLTMVPGVGHNNARMAPAAARLIFENERREHKPAEDLPVRGSSLVRGLDADLLAHWPLKGDARDRSGNGAHAEVCGAVDFQSIGPDGAVATTAGFNGRDAWLEVPLERVPTLGSGDFSISVWVHADEATDDVPGDLISRYDPATRRGFHLSLKTNAGVTSSQANFRHLQFGIDDDRASAWIDCGRPGNALLAFALAVHQGMLYAGTCEPGAEESGRVFRHAGGEKWIDRGAPDRSNAVTALAVFDGQLYAGTGKYRVAGSALPESPNEHRGGRVFRYAGEQKWTDCGQLPEAEAVGGLVVFRGALYASSLYRPAGFFRYDGEQGWIDCGVPDGKRVESLGVYNGHLYASSYDGGHVYRFDGDDWTDCGQLGENTQTYSLAVYEGRLHVGTWPSGRVYRFEEIGRWTDVGRLGEELEVMGMLVHNGRLIAGTLPLAEVYEYRGEGTWNRLARLDHTPDVRYRRAWTMAEHDGRLFCSTLPSGKVFAFEAGRSVMWGRSFPSGWRHVAAVRAGDQLSLYVDGEQVAESTPLDAAFDLDSESPLRIGFGANDCFHGRLSDLRLYGRALRSAEIRLLSQVR